MANASDDYVNRFDNHPMHKALGELLNQVTGLQANPKIATAARFKLERLQAGIEKARRLFAVVDKWMVGTVTPKEIYRAASAAKDGITNFINAGLGDETHLNAAIDQLENQILPAIQRLPRLDSPGEASILAEQVHEQIKRNDELIRETQAAWEQAIAAWGKDATQAVVALNEAIASAERLKQAVDAQDERLEKLVARSDAAISDINTKAAEAEAQRAKTALEAEISRAQRFESVANTLQAQFSERAKHLEQELAKEHKLFVDAGEEKVARLQQLEAQASELLQLIGNKGVTAPFQHTAEADRRVAKWLRVVAGVCFLGLVGTVIFVASDVHIATTKGEGIDWGRAIFRLLSGLILSIPAYYFAREAAKFQSESDRNRRVQLELASIGPFIEHLDVTKRDALKEELTRRYFGSPYVAPELEKPIDPKDLLGLLRVALRRGR